MRFRVVFEAHILGSQNAITIQSMFCASMVNIMASKNSSLLHIFNNIYLYYNMEKRQNTLDSVAGVKKPGGRH